MKTFTNLAHRAFKCASLGTINKKRYYLFIITMLLTLGVGNAWGADVSVTWPKTMALSTTATTVDGDANVTIKVSEANTYTNPLRFYAGKTTTIEVAEGYQLKSVAYEASSTGNYVTYAKDATVSPDVTPSVNGKIITWDLSGSNTKTFTFKPSTQTRCNGITITYTAASGETPGEGGGEEPDEPTPDPEPEPGTGGETTTVTYVFKDDSNCPGNDQTWFNGTIDEFSGWTATKGTNDPKYFTTGTGLRVYNGGKFTITSTKVMTSITLTFAGTTYTFSTSNATTPQTVTPNATSYEWSVERTCRLQKIEITYAADAGGDEGGSEEQVLSVTPGNITWEGIAASAEKSEEITVTLSNIEAVMAELSGDNPTAFSIDKDLLEASGKIIVSKNTTTIGDYAAILTITDTDTQTKTIALSMEVVADPEPTGTFEKFTGAIEEGDYVLVANETTDALKNTITSNRFDCGTVVVDADKIVNPDKSVIWHIAANGTYWTMYNESTTKYAGGTASRNQGALLDDVTDLAKWTITVDGEGVYTFENYGRSQQASYADNKFLSKNSNSQNAYWATYASGQKNPVLYKKSDGKQPAGLAYATTKYLTKLGDAFTTPTLTNPNSLTVTYSSSDNNVATVDNTGTVTIKAVGAVEITATFAGSATHRQGTASYTLCVTEHAGTEVDPYSVADARRVIDVMETAEGVYATGIVSEIVTAYNATYGNITYNISIDGSTAADQLQAYRGKGVNGENFSSANDIKVGDEVVVKGNLKKHGTTYEFDADNHLVSLKREKQQAGLAYEEKEHTANVGEDFTEPALTNPNSLTVTYSSSNTALATVDATTGEVSILAAGKVTITASSAADATYAAGSASYNITISDPSLAVATLPFYFDGKKADIEGTAGMTQEGIDSDYNAAPYLKFNTAGDWAIVQFDSEPGEFSFLLKQNGQNAGTFTVYESANGEDYTPIWSGGDLGGNGQSATIEPTLSATARYVKFEYTTKGASTNYGLGSISIQKADHRAEAGIAWNPATISLTVGDAFSAPTFNNPNGLSGITFASSNETLATVDNAGAITLESGKTGTATITATFADGHADYKPAEATCVITVSPKSEKVVILAQYGDQWYALKAAYLSGKTDRLDAIPVNYVGGKLYNVAEADKASIEWSSVVEGDKVSFLNDGKYLKGKTTTTLLFEENADGLYQWDNTTYTMTIGTTVRSFLYNGEAFRNFAVSNAGKVVNDVLYSSLPVVTAPVYATGDAYGRSVNLGEDGYRYGTICLPFGSTNYTGAEFFECVGKEEGKVYLASVTTLVAGTPYIFLASATEVAVYGNGTTAATPGSKNGLVGTFTNDTEVAIGNYILKDNALCQAEAICWVNAYRAYLVMEDVPGEFTKMPGRRYIGMSTKGENTTTGLDNITNGENTTIKVIENGQLIIIRNGEKFNAQGQKL